MGQPLPEANFPGASAPRTDFAATRSRQRTRPLFLDIDLTTARSIAAGTALALPIAGNSIYVDPASSSGVCTAFIEGEDKNATPLTLFPGSSFDVPFTYMLIENTAQPGSRTRLLYGVDIDFRPNNSAGVSILNAISVIDASLQRTQQGIAAVGQGLQDAVAGEYPHVQIKNPTGSGKNVYVKSVILSGTNAGGVIWGQYNADLTTLVQTSQLKSLGTAGITQFRRQSAAAVIVLTTTHGSLGISANVPLPIPLAEPYLLEPGEALVFYLGTLNSRLYLTAQDILEVTV